MNVLSDKDGGVFIPAGGGEDTCEQPTACPQRAGWNLEVMDRNEKYFEII